ncbi:Polyphosphoinositide phosphatase [Armadillidium nasatum]|uniref:Polyphosphoinositide phosphatase n=1 Tax=Armadillidium nasatum TaxID=96803 RepID=A0A5N5TEJ3_9CRUS|nr:Polyphosphoinositide phosphatase [Armadillidium nasatum]
MEERNEEKEFFHPIINGLQKMALYTTRSVEYSHSEIKDILEMIKDGNKPAITKSSSGAVRTVSAFGIFGLIRFLEGYYLILITKRRKVAVIGQHSIYKVEDTSIIYIPHESVRKVHEDENKYLKLLSNIDLTSNFYFSYTYDLTNSLQYNMAPVKIRDELFSEPLRKNAHHSWILSVTQGFVAQGDVANEVETEQIVHDAHISSHINGRFTSFVQVSGKHFNKLMRRFGSPMIVLNLVKKREKKRHESILNDEYKRLIQQLNVTLPPKHKIQHISVDMARINKDKKENVMSRLAKISYQCIKKTGFFQSHTPYYMNHLDPDPDYKQLERISVSGDKNFGKKGIYTLEQRGRYQTGIVRVNCVDCLDRTNTAQFALGKCALAFQLYTLGVLEKPSIEFDSACVRMLEEMYEDHGDTLALQYGGSQLVHRIATYRKTAPWTSQGNDIMQSLSRYFSNTFSDQEKQQAINLFLGVFVPLKQNVAIWDLASDYLLHHSLTGNVWPCHKKSALHWWDDEVMDCLPLASDQVNKKPEFLIPVKKFDPRIDLYYDFHRPYEFSVMSEFFTYHMNHSSSYMDRNEAGQIPYDESPFSVRELPGNRVVGPGIGKMLRSKANEERRNSLPSPNISQHSNASSGVSSTETEHSDEELLSVSGCESEPETEKVTRRPLTFAELFPPPENTYGPIIKPLKEEDKEKHERYIEILNHISPQGDLEREISGNFSEGLQIEPLITVDEDYGFLCVPTISEISRKIYKDYISIGEGKLCPANNEDLIAYRRWNTFL